MHVLHDAGEQAQFFSIRHPLTIPGLLYVSPHNPDKPDSAERYVHYRGLLHVCEDVFFSLSRKNF